MSEMFCFQCEQTAGCTGCTGRAGVCGKSADVANLQDKLTGALIGLAVDAGGKCPSKEAANVMDLAIPFQGKTGSYIVYVKDNKSSVRQLSSVLIGIIAQALLVGLIISVLLSLLLAKALVTPIVSLTNAAERVAAGDFSSKPVSDAQDEIGVLTRTFDGMSGDWIAGVSETTGTFAFGVGVATFFPQPVRSSAMAAASSTALRSTFFICIPPKSELYLFACIVCPAVPANMTKHARFFDNVFKR